MLRAPCTCLKAGASRRAVPDGSAAIKPRPLVAQSMLMRIMGPLSISRLCVVGAFAFGAAVASAQDVGSYQLPPAPRPSATAQGPVVPDVPPPRPATTPSTTPTPSPTASSAPEAPRLVLPITPRTSARSPRPAPSAPVAAPTAQPDQAPAVTPDTLPLPSATSVAIPPPVPAPPPSSPFLPLLPRLSKPSRKAARSGRGSHWFWLWLRAAAGMRYSSAAKILQRPNRCSSRPSCALHPRQKSRRKLLHRCLRSAWTLRPRG